MFPETQKPTETNGNRKLNWPIADEEQEALSYYEQSSSYCYKLNNDGLYSKKV